MILRLSFEGRELVSPLLGEILLRPVKILYQLIQLVQKFQLNQSFRNLHPSNPFTQQYCIN
jgi:hypothetical protein